MKRKITQACRKDTQERVPAILTELQALLLAMQASGAILPKSIAGNAISYTLKRWEKLTLFMKHPVIELSTNWAENSMRPISIVNGHWKTWLLGIRLTHQHTTRSMREHGRLSARLTGIQCAVW
jgi:hypothetical protein